jgi:hypothetical protein
VCKDKGVHDNILRVEIQNDREVHASNIDKKNKPIDHQVEVLQSISVAAYILHSYRPQNTEACQRDTLIRLALQKETSRI